MPFYLSQNILYLLQSIYASAHLAASEIMAFKCHVFIAHVIAILAYFVLMTGKIHDAHDKICFHDRYLWSTLQIAFNR